MFLIIAADIDVRFLEQNERIAVLESEVVDWSDNITALEDGLSDAQERVDALEETITGVSLWY